MMQKAFYLLTGILLIVVSCKKEAPAQPSIYGKWFFGKVNSKLYNSTGVLIDTVSQSNFTSSDFVYYFTDGTGSVSNTSKISAEANLTLFSFTLKGNLLTQTGPYENAVISETITALTTNTLSIHTEYLIPDPNDGLQTDKEIDDISYHR